MLDKNYNNYGTMNDMIDNSINITHNYFKERINLKERDDSQEYEYVGYCVGEGKKFKDFHTVICVNVHSYNQFICDHVHIDIPNNLYDEFSFTHNIMKFIGIAEPYERNNGTKDYTIKVTKILNTNNRLVGFDSNAIKVSFKFFENDFYDKVKNKIENDEITTLQLAEFLIRSFDRIDIGLSANENVCYTNFITNFILSQYFLNGKLDRMCQQRYIINELNRPIILDLCKLASYLLMSIRRKLTSICMWKQFFMKVTEVCNILQGIDKDLILKNKHNKKEYDYIDKNIKMFGNKIEFNESKSMFDKIRARHKDFGFRYLEEFNKEKDDYITLEEFNIQLDHYLAEALYFEGYITI